MAPAHELLLTVTLACQVAFRDLTARLGVVDHRHQPARVVPNRGRLERALANFDLLVVQDGFETPTPSGRARLLCVTAFSDAPNERFQFVLNTGRTVEHWHTRTKAGRVDILEQMAPEGWVEINPRDATRLGVHPGDRVRMRSRRGLVEGVSVRVTATVREGEAFMPFHYDELCVNRLTVDEFDPVSRKPNYKQSAVDIERCR